jgi:hypothetical protein
MENIFACAALCRGAKPARMRAKEEAMNNLAGWDARSPPREDGLPSEEAMNSFSGLAQGAPSKPREDGLLSEELAAEIIQTAIMEACYLGDCDGQTGRHID